MVEGIAQRVGHGGGPGGKLFPAARVARAKPLGVAVSPHSSPLVVISAEPNFGEIGKDMVVGDVGRGQVIVIVEQRGVRGVAVIKFSGGVGTEEEVVVNEGAHGRRGRAPGGAIFLMTNHQCLMTDRASEWGRN